MKASELSLAAGRHSLALICCTGFGAVLGALAAGALLFLGPIRGGNSAGLQEAAFTGMQIVFATMATCVFAWAPLAILFNWLQKRRSVRWWLPPGLVLFFMLACAFAVAVLLRGRLSWKWLALLGASGSVAFTMGFWLYWQVASTSESLVRWLRGEESPESTS